MKMTKKSYLTTTSNKVFLLIVKFCVTSYLPYSFIYLHESSALVTWSPEKTGFQLVVE